MTGIDPRRVLVFAGTFSLALIYLISWTNMIRTPALRTGSDFIAFYTAGRIAQTYDAAQVYDIGLQREVQEKQVGFTLAPRQVLLYNHLPFLIPLLSGIASGDYVASFVRWALILIALYTTGIAILSRLLLQAGLEPRFTLLAGLASALFFPIFVSMLNGQDTAFLFLGGTIWMFGLLAGRDAVAGLGLGLMAVRPHIAVALAVPFLFRRRRVFLWSLASAGALAAFSVLVVGPNGIRGFTNLLFISAGGEWYGMKESEMLNLIGLLSRSAPGLGADLIRRIGWGTYFLTVLGLCALWARRPEPDEKSIGLAIILALFCAPHLHFHDLALLLLPIYALLLRNQALQWFATRHAALLPLTTSILLLAGNFTPVSKYFVPYAVLLVLALVLWPPCLADSFFDRQE